MLPYSQAYISDDIEFIIKQSLKLIPTESHFHEIITDIIEVHNQSPNDWKIAWNFIHDKWVDTDLGPWGVFDTFNNDRNKILSSIPIKNKTKEIAILKTLGLSNNSL